MIQNKLNSQSYQRQNFSIELKIQDYQTIYRLIFL
jgi:hypothetical protein